ncbi:MAG: AAA family ATPase [Magnetococcales bacterium]|nr:AAA family ATPase [Magnetococcales bacterium]
MWAGPASRKAFFRLARREGGCVIKELKVKNLLSFGPNEKTISLGNLNVFIGPNGSGKSNFLEVIDLLRSAPDEFAKPIRDGGGIQDWLWKADSGIPIASIDAVVSAKNTSSYTRYILSFTATGLGFSIIDEKIEKEKPDRNHVIPYLYYHFRNGAPVINIKGNERSLQRELIDPTRSILAQRRDPEHYPEVSHLGTELPKIRLYREWSFGRYTIPRIPQKMDLPNEYLLPDGSNLGLVLNRLRKDIAVKERLLQAMQALYEGIDDFGLDLEGNTGQVYLIEGRRTIPATRLSDGTLRYLCLLAILCHPKPPPLVCIEEPELGLHPDILPTLADLLKEASERCQLIVTTHSEGLVNAMSDCPEAVQVCEKRQGETTIQRLDPVDLKPWLEKYRLGTLWTRGDIGGTRW